MGNKILGNFGMREKYQALFSSELGEEVLAHICKEGFFNKSTFVKNDPNETILNEGSRRLALSIHTYAKKNTDQIKETIERNMS